MRNLAIFLLFFYCRSWPSLDTLCWLCSLRDLAGLSRPLHPADPSVTPDSNTLYCQGEFQPRPLYSQNPRRLPKEAAYGILTQWLQASNPDERDEPARSGLYVQGPMGFQGQGGYSPMGEFRPRSSGMRGRLAIDKSKSTCNSCKKYGHWAWALSWGRGFPAEQKMSRWGSYIC